MFNICDFWINSDIDLKKKKKFCVVKYLRESGVQLIRKTVFFFLFFSLRALFTQEVKHPSLIKACS